MKQSEIIIGNEYLFYRTETEHKKDMCNTIVKVISKKKGKRRPNYQSGILLTGYGNSPIRFKLSNGRNANASELKQL